MAFKGRAIEALLPTLSCLVVDDDWAVREAFNLALSDDYTLHFAEDGQTALHSLGRYPIDLVILDLRLPDLHGIDVLRRIRRLYPSLPVMIVTGFSSHEAAIDAANLGVAGYVEKPFDVEEMKRKIESALSEITLRRTELDSLNSQAPPGVAHAALGLIRTHCEEKLTVKGIARALRVSPRQLSDAFREAWGLSIKDYLIRVRMEHAMTLLRHPNLPVKTIAVILGFRDSSHFCKHFQRMTGQTPSAYRRLITG